MSEMSGLAGPGGHDGDRLPEQAVLVTDVACPLEDFGEFYRTCTSTKNAFDEHWLKLTPQQHPIHGCFSAWA